MKTMARVVLYVLVAAFLIAVVPPGVSVVASVLSQSW